MKRFLIALVILASASPVAAQQSSFALGSASAARDASSLTAARELYASARYDEALVVLNGLKPAAGPATADLKTIEQYRSLCLLALGRAEEAESAIAAVVTVDPFFAPTESEASPRVRSAFSDVRLKLLPGIAAARYEAAKLAFDRKEHANAERMFRELVTLLDDQQMNGRLPDMRVLAAGFLQLAIAAAAPPPEPKPAPKAEPAAPAAASSPVPVVPRIYGSDDAGVVAPGIIRQEVPNVPASIYGMTRERGLLEVTIDEQGRVVAMVLRLAIHPMYDKLLLNAVRDWKYRPATMNGVPVRFRKVVQITLPRK
ncbi:MAG: energy transducer TonB [Vicinamibacterales bacterium]